MKWRLGLDVGTNSLGWAGVILNEDNEPVGLLDAGVRVFTDGRNPKDKQSLAVTRRMKRGARRNRDRYVQRRDEFMKLLIDFGLMPQCESERKSLEKIDPWCLRAKGVNDKLSLHEFGRALFHLQQRRGFKSNRKVDKGDSDKGKIAEGSVKTEILLKERNVKTLGEFFGKPRLELENLKSKVGKEQALQEFDGVIPSTRARLHGEGAKSVYEFYPTRDLILEEFDILWSKQSEFHTELTTQARDKLRHSIEWQRPLKPQAVGRCTFLPDELRAPWALPSSQRRRLFETLNNLTYDSVTESNLPLTLEQRNLVAKVALTQKTTKFDRMRKLLKLSPDVRFNIESTKRKDIKGDETAARLDKKNLWYGWRSLPLEHQDALTEILLGLEPFDENTPTPIWEMSNSVTNRVSSVLAMDYEEAQNLLTSTDPKLLARWISERYGFDDETALRIVNLPLPDGHQSLGRTANSRILKHLMDSQLTYDKAVAIEFQDHRAYEGLGEVSERLPYYGAVLNRTVGFGTGNPNDSLEVRLGRVANPTVHVALNQIRHVVNAIISKHGKPSEIVIELARDLPLSAEGKNELEREQRLNQIKNNERAETIEEHKVQNTYRNRLKLRLYEELPETDKVCVLTGKRISISQLFSDEVEIDHILPFSRTLDDGFANKILVTRQANRDKGRRTPYEAFGMSPNDYEWDEIQQRAFLLPDNKRRRFNSDSMERYENGDQDFLARQLNDTKFIARATRTYLGSLFGGGDTALKHVWATPGRLTSDLRWVWGLDSILGGNNVEDPDTPIRKNRDDHRHHAIDAIVIALTDRRMLQIAAKEAKEKGSDQDIGRLLAGLSEPWIEFRQEVKDKIGKVLISHKQDHGLGGALHDETYYGRKQNPRKQGQDVMVTRKAILDFKTYSELDEIADNRIREELKECTSEFGIPYTGQEFENALFNYVNEKRETRTNPRRVRIHRKITDNTPLRPVYHGQEKKYVKHIRTTENFCLDIFETKDGRWLCESISRFDANQKDGPIQSNTPEHWRKKFPDAQLRMRIHKNDTLIVEDKMGNKRIMKAVKLNPSANRMYLAEHMEAGKLEQRHKDKEDLFSWDLESVSKLKYRKARLAHVDKSGELIDPGFFQ